MICMGASVTFAREPSDCPNKFLIVAISRIKRPSPVVVRENVKRYRLGTEPRVPFVSACCKSFLPRPYPLHSLSITIASRCALGDPLSNSSLIVTITTPTIRSGASLSQATSQNELAESRLRIFFSSSRSLLQRSSWFLLYWDIEIREFGQ